MRNFLKKLLVPGFIFFFVLGGIGSLHIEKVYALAQGCYNANGQIQGNPPIDNVTCQKLIATGASVHWETGDAPLPTDACTTVGAAGSPEYKKCIDDLAGNGNKQADAQKNPATPSFWADVISSGMAWVVQMILQLVSYLVGIAAALLNGIVYYTVVNVTDNYDNLKPILEAWKVLRDIANMSFIFVLIYAGIMTILGQGGDHKKTIVNIVIAAVLLNFSLFFTRLVIDVGNILALTFYDAIAPGSLTATGVFNWSQAGLATAFTKALHLQALYDTSSKITIGSTIIVGIMGTIMLLITAFIFFAIAIMFLIRYVVLILVLILSPIAFVASALPAGIGVAKLQTRWKDALIGQTFFAPIYFLMTWISLRVLSGVMDAFGGTGKIDATALNGLSVGIVQGNLEGAFLMFMNFAIVIVLLIASLTISKEWADKAGGEVGKLTSWATQKAGGMSMGTLGWAGRNTIGAGASRLAQSDRFQRFAGRSFVGQALLNRTTAAAGSSFDFRNTKAAGAALGKVDAGQGAKGGYQARLQEKLAAKDKFAQTLNNTTAVAGRPSAREAYAARISGGALTHGGTRNSANTIMGTLGRHNRVAASKILQSQLAPFETQQQNLQTRENQLNQQLANMTNEQATINAVPAATRTTQQNNRLRDLNDTAMAVPPGSPLGTLPSPTNRNSIAYVQYHLTNTQADLTRADAEVTRIRGVISGNQLNNPANPIVNPVTGRSRPSRADEQNY